MNKGPRRGRAKQSSRESETISVSSIQSNHDSVGTVTEEDKVSRRKGLAKLIMFGLLVIVGFYFLLYHVISEAKRKQNVGFTDKTDAVNGGVQKGCGADSFMLRDGVCDEVTNTPRCLYDGGDCCREVKDTSMCMVCTCRLEIDEEEIHAQFKQLGVRQFKDPNDFHGLIGSKQFDIKVGDVLSDQVCSTLCLTHDDKDKFNAWHYNSIATVCRCAWIESMKCIGEVDLDETTNEEATPFDAALAYVQLDKMIPCDCLAIDTNVSHPITNLGKKNKEAHSAWHCQQLCREDFECTLFSWIIQEKQCKLMKADQEVSEESQIYNEVGILSSVKECSMFHLYFSQATTPWDIQPTTDPTRTENSNDFPATYTTLGVCVPSQASTNPYIGDCICDIGHNNFEDGYDGGDCCFPEAVASDCQYGCDCLKNTATDGFCTNRDEDCCYEYSVCDCIGNACKCHSDGLKKCQDPGPISQQSRIINFKHSSVYSERKMCHSKYVADRFFSKVWEEGTFISNNIGYPWLQLEFDEVIAVHRIVYFDRSTACGHRFSNVFFHVGNSSSLIGWDGTSTDPECYHFTGTSMEYSVHDFKCTETNHGRFLVVQMRQSNYLQIAELLVFDDPVYPVPENTIFSSPSHDIDKATDGFVGNLLGDFSFQTHQQTNPWFQLEFPTPVEVIYVVIVQRIDAEGEQFKDVKMTLGDTPATNGQLSTNPEIAFFSGPSQTGRIDVIPTSHSQTGKYFIMQKTGEGQQQLMFGEILVYIGEDLCQSGSCERSPDPELLYNKEKFPYQQC